MVPLLQARRTANRSRAIAGTYTSATMTADAIAAAERLLPWWVPWRTCC
jgi:hypothetical protein